MTKTVVLLSLLCLLVLGAAAGVIQVLGRIATDLHRSALALDALVLRVAAVEQDLAAMSEDVYWIAEDVGVIADSLLAEEEGGEQGEAVRAPRVPAGRRHHAVRHRSLVRTVAAR